MCRLCSKITLLWKNNTLKQYVKIAVFNAKDITKQPIPGDTTTGTSTARITKATTSATRVTKDTTSATTVTKATTSATTMTEATTLAATTSAHFAKQPLPTPVPTTTASAKLATGYNHESISR